MNIETININGTKYFTAVDAAKLTKKSYKSILQYVNSGNSVRKMESNKIGHAQYIDAVELHTYPYAKKGQRSYTRIYHYDEDFEVVDCEHCSKGNFVACELLSKIKRKYNEQ